MYAVFALVVAAVVFAVVAVALGWGRTLEDEVPVTAGPQLGDDPMSEADVAALRFAVVARGYRMDQVDDVLRRLGAELAERDERIERLEDTVRRWVGPEAVEQLRPVHHEPS
ncbi:DivIVA domain-containing protein [Phytoactinopolyspora limicola]|uniref:DivIVA domain-containing protein n=1 Tax=Phytoactinopolyspora limicola TaxID=2715536 RepID=UPI0014090A67|nr:DivIVA domain-containing protein [Phytoactinopolyspora limicola]